MSPPSATFTRRSNCRRRAAGRRQHLQQMRMVLEFDEDETDSSASPGSSDNSAENRIILKREFPTILGSMRRSLVPVAQTFFPGSRAYQSLCAEARRVAAHGEPRAEDGTLLTGPRDERQVRLPQKGARGAKLKSFCAFCASSRLIRFPVLSSISRSAQYLPPLPAFATSTA